MEYKKIKFGGGLWPYVEISLYDYNLNRERLVKVSTDDLNNAIQNNLDTDNKDLLNRIREIDAEIKYFVPSKLILKGDEKSISNYIEDNFLYK